MRSERSLSRDIVRWVGLRLLVPLFPFGVAVAVALLLEAGNLQLSQLVQVPEILFLGVVLGASGLKDISDIYVRYAGAAVHDLLAVAILFVGGLAIALYSALAGIRIVDLTTEIGNPNLAVAVIITGLLVVFSGMAHFLLLRLEYNL